MEVFNKTHVLVIEKRIKQSGLTNPQLVADMLDHYCCVVEVEMDKGASFEEAYQTAWKSISPNGLVEIENELFFMLNFNKQIQMKKMMYLTGFLSAMFIASGFLFRILHWPGALAISFLGYAFLFLCCIIIVANRYVNKTQTKRNDLLRFYAGSLTALFISVGSMFKGLHWPGANMITLIGFLFLVFAYLPAFFYHAYKSSIVQQNLEEIRE